MRGYVVASETVPAERADGDTASTQVTIDAGVGCPALEQRVITFARGRSRERVADRQEVLYVVAGRGSLTIGDQSFELEPEMGAYVAAGERYGVVNPGPDELVVVAVLAPQGNGAAPEGRRRTVSYRDQPVFRAGTDREFRYLVDEALGSRDVTQFMGLIPPGRAPMHSHTYDEVIYIVEGSGMLHIDGVSTPIAPGSCMHLPPLVDHCLENSGSSTMRVLGVFHPSGDPASRASEANQ